MGPQKVSTLSGDLISDLLLIAALRMILSGLGGIILVEVYAAVMQREFQNTNNKVGKGFAILGIYIFVVAYCKTTLLSTLSSVWI